MHPERFLLLKDFVKTVLTKEAHLQTPLRIRNSEVKWDRNVKATLAVLSGELTREQANQKILGGLCSDRVTRIVISTTHNLCRNLPPEDQRRFPSLELDTEIKRFILCQSKKSRNRLI